jgi:hypothetical protein
LVEPSQGFVHTTPCSIRQVRWTFPCISCPRCGREAPRVWDVRRVAIDIDLDQPVVLAVDVSVHVCATCSRMFRAQPPFLRPRAIYTRRVVQKAVESVHHDGLAARTVPDRLARDFWVKPSEKMIRVWCRAFAAEVDFTADYQPWVVANFSGILCVDEIYQGELALLLAVDPTAPDGDRLVGYTLLSNTKAVDRRAIKAFLEQLRAVGVHPDEVITDDSPLYPAALAEIWPVAVHQLCLFHAARRVVRAVSDVVKQIRRSIPAPPPASLPSLHGRLREKPPAADQRDADAERYRWRLARRAVGIAKAHMLRQNTSSIRAIGRQLGVNRRTIEKWLTLAPPDPRVVADLAAAAGALPAVEPPPPPPWHDWDQVRRVREDLRLHRTLFLHQNENLTIDERHTLAELLAGPVGSELRAARGFLEAWFAIWKDDRGRRRTPADAEQHYKSWQADAEAANLAPLRRQQQHLDADHFARLSAFLRDPAWESTNNAAERGGRAFRHSQHPHFRLRSANTIDADLKIRAHLQRERFCSPPPVRLHHCQRGRHASDTPRPNSTRSALQR